jgi:UDP-3-O-[3-hydroxymyristoyl] N-acetylglucosamine deacetylase
MAALSGCGIDNVIVELNGPEVPVMDGSSAPFVLLVECAGVLTQEVPRNYIKVLKSVVVCDGDRSMHLSPSEDFSISFEIDFDSDVVSRQAFTLNVNERSFKEDLGGARTFGFAEEIHALRKNGFGRGGSLENAVIVDGDTVLNKGGLRFEDEFVRHKVLDCVGDLYLAGCPILAHVQCIRSGHSLSHKLLKSLFSDQSAWKFETFSSSGRDGVHQASAPNTPEPVAATA